MTTTGSAHKVQMDPDVQKSIEQVESALTKGFHLVCGRRMTVLRTLKEEQEDLGKQKEKVLQDIQKKRNALLDQEKMQQEVRKRFFDPHKALEAQVQLNVGGEMIKTRRETLTKESQSLLSAMFMMETFPGPPDEDEGGERRFFLDRNPDLFHKILEYLWTGTHPACSPAEEHALNQELDHFALPRVDANKRSQPTITARDGGGYRFTLTLDELVPPDRPAQERWYTSPDFLHSQDGESDRYRLVFTERKSFLSVFLQNVDAGLRLANSKGKEHLLKFTLVPTDGKESMHKTEFLHTFNRQRPNVGFNYFHVLRPTSSLKRAGYIHYTGAGGVETLLFDLEIRPPPVIEDAEEPAGSRSPR
eukprot:Hpha_TRINITY_DN16575_c6_g1::TRINITY_DN16575_c6_g1_i1::g.135820::m.135820